MCNENGRVVESGEHDTDSEEAGVACFTACVVIDKTV